MMFTDLWEHLPESDLLEILRKLPDQLGNQLKNLKEFHFAKVLNAVLNSLEEEKIVTENTNEEKLHSMLRILSCNGIYDTDKTVKKYLTKEALESGLFPKEETPDPTLIDFEVIKKYLTGKEFERGLFSTIGSMLDAVTLINFKMVIDGASPSLKTDDSQLLIGAGSEILTDKVIEDL